MSYNPVTDFLALLRTTTGGVQTAQMPGLDFVVEALYRAGFVNLYVGQTAPTSNQATTAWFKPAVPSWTAEGALFLWNGTTYLPATPALWTTYFIPLVTAYVFQSITGASGVVAAGHQSARCPACRTHCNRGAAPKPRSAESKETADRRLLDIGYRSYDYAHNARRCYDRRSGVMADAFNSRATCGPDASAFPRSEFLGYRTMIKRIFVVLFSLLATPALAQWQTPSHAVPVGKGAGVTGFSNAAPGAAGQVLTSNGASADPTFQSIGNTLNAQSAPYTIQASDNNKTVYVTGNPGVVTLPTVTGGGFVANAQVRVCNGNANTAATHAFGLSGFPNPVFARLYQQQCVW